MLYDRMDIKLEERGESFYNPMLQPLVKDLVERQVAEQDQSAWVIRGSKKK